MATIQTASTRTDTFGDFSLCVWEGFVLFSSFPFVISTGWSILSKSEPPAQVAECGPACGLRIHTQRTRHVHKSVIILNALFCCCCCCFARYSKAVPGSYIPRTSRASFFVQIANRIESRMLRQNPKLSTFFWHCSSKCRAFASILYPERITGRSIISIEQVPTQRQSNLCARFSLNFGAGGRDGF